MKNMKRKRVKGSSLVFVIIAVAFVGILATIVTRIVSMNLNIKSVDRQVKKNFYNAESVMDEVDIAVENLTADAMKEAYVKIMGDYVNSAYSTTDQNSIQVRFSYLYLNELVKSLSDVDSIAPDYTLSAGATYKVQKIKDKMAALLSENEKDKTVKCWDYVDSGADGNKTEPMVLKFDPSSGGERSLTLKNVKVVYYETDSNGQKKSTWLKTDIKIAAPKLSFESGNIYPEFTKYSIIGDDKVSASNSCRDDVVNGSVYAGSKGLIVEGYSGSDSDTKGETLTIGGTGTNVITRGNVEVVQGGRLCLGTDSSDISVWTENLNTTAGVGSSTGSKAPAKLTVYGKSYVHDDLSLNSPYSLVSYRSGSYYGYTFNRDNSTKANAYTNSDCSSAIVLNGKHSSLYMGDSMSSILLGGQAYVSRNKYDIKAENRKNILLGQSLSVKSDQKFYMVHNDDLAEGFTNPMSWGTYKEYIKTKGTKITGGRIPLVSEKYKQLKNLLNKTEPVTTYVVSMTTTSSSEDSAMVYLYYNFRNAECANTYFEKYVNSADLQERIVSSQYLKFDGAFSGLDIDLSANLAILASSNVITHVDQKTIETQEGNMKDNDETTLMANAIQYASQYKSYQLTLTDGNWTSYSANADSQGYKAFDLYNDGTVNLKEKDTIFEALMAKTSDKSQYLFVSDAANDPTANGYIYTLNGYGNALMKIVPVSAGSGTVYAIFVVQLDGASISSGVCIPTSKIFEEAKSVGFDASDDNKNKVMIVSNGHIAVDKDVHGIVISDTEVVINQPNCTMTAEPSALQAMFSAQKSVESGGATPATDFMSYFSCFENMTFGAEADSVDMVDISKCINHVNWTKNEDE